MDAPIRFLLPTALIALLLLPLPAIVDYIPDHHRGLVTREGGPPEVLGPGFHWRVAGFRPRPDIYPLIPVRLRDRTGVRTREGILVRAEYFFGVRITPADLENFHRSKGPREVVAAIRDAARAALQTAAVRAGTEAWFQREPGGVLGPRFEAALRPEGLTFVELAVEPLGVEEALRSSAILLGRQLPGAARRLLESAVSLFPSSAEPHLALARLYERIGEIDLAEEQYLSALYLDLSLHEAMEWLWQRMVQVGDVDRAVRILQAGRDRVPGSADYRSWLASLLMLEGNTEAAAAELREGLRHHPADAALQVNLAAVHLTREEYEEAAELLEAVLAGNPAHRSSKFNLGLALRGLGRTEAALGTLLELEQAGESAPELYNELARTYLALELPGEAAEQLRRSLELRPDQEKVRELLDQVEAQIEE